MNRVIYLLAFVIIAAASSEAFAQSSEYLKAAAERSGLSTKEFNKRVCDSKNDAVAARVLREYGAMFITVEGALPPAKCVFENGAAVIEFQSRAKMSQQRFGSTDITLQTEAMNALNNAIKDAATSGLKITPRGGSIAGLRSYEDTVRLWDSRFYKALTHWESRGKIAKDEADAARKLTAFQQVPLALKWEEKGYWFSTAFDRTILSSVAAPGTSQHLSGLALDVTEFSNSRVRAILNKHGWFQTVANDTPHFTFLGRAEDDLPKFGLKPVTNGAYKFWIPSTN